MEMEVGAVIMLVGSMLDFGLEVRGKILLGPFILRIGRILDR